MNPVIHIAAISRAYYRRKLAEGKKPLEAVRCLKRRISDAIFRQLVADAQRAAGTGPGGHCGATQDPARPAYNRTPTLRSATSRTAQPTLRRMSATRNTDHDTHLEATG